MNKYLHLGSLVAALSLGCANSVVVEPASPVESVKSAEPVNEAPVEPVTKSVPLPKELGLPYVCDKIDLQDGAYNAGTPVMPATYLVRKNASECGLLLGGVPPAMYVDSGCDNTLDFVVIEEAILSREELAKETDNLAVFDQALQLGQMFACKENKIRNYVE